MNGRSAFTLVELVLCIALVALLSALAVPHLLGSLPDYRVGGATRQILADCRLAKALAVEHGVSAFLQFDAPTNRYHLILDEDRDGAPSPGDRQVKRVDLSSLFEQIEFSSVVSGDPVTFDGDVAEFLPRSTSNGGAVYLHPRNNHLPGRERRVTILSTTARARAYRWTGSSWE